MESLDALVGHRVGRRVWRRLGEDFSPCAVWLGVDPLIEDPQSGSEPTGDRPTSRRAPRSAIFGAGGVNGGSNAVCHEVGDRSPTSMSLPVPVRNRVRHCLPPGSG